MLLTFLARLGIPFAMAIGGVVAWRGSRRKKPDGTSGDDAPTWRDDSLDEWRREREIEAEVERQERQAARSSRPQTEAVEVQGDLQTTRTRLGG